jgi:hypothetical protein
MIHWMSGSLALPSAVIFPWMRGMIVTRLFPVGSAIGVPLPCILQETVGSRKKAPLPYAGKSYGIYFSEIFLEILWGKGGRAALLFTSGPIFFRGMTW